MSSITITDLTGLNTDHYPLDGRYSGTWSGNVVNFSTPYGDYTGKASTYVKGLGIRCVVEFRDNQIYLEEEMLHSF